MVFDQIKGWKGEVEIDGVKYNNVNALNKPFYGQHSIKLYPTTETVVIAEDKTNNRQDNVTNSSDIPEVGGVYRFFVKEYMTKPGTPSFDFMDRFNEGIPMPMREMYGEIIRETKGMYFVSLRALTEPTTICRICGRVLTNPESKHYGIGPICLAKLNISWNIDQYSEIKKDLQEIQWKGWLIKKAIDKWEVYNEAN